MCEHPAITYASKKPELQMGLFAFHKTYECERQQHKQKIIRMRAMVTKARKNDLEENKMRQIKGYIEHVTEYAQNTTITFVGGLTTGKDPFKQELTLQNEVIRNLLTHHAYQAKGTLTYDKKQGIIMIAGTQALSMNFSALTTLANELFPKKKGPAPKDPNKVEFLKKLIYNTPITITIGTPESGKTINDQLKNVEIGIIFNEL